MPKPIDDVEADATAPAGVAVVPFATDDDKFDVAVKPPGQWKSRATRALRDGDFLGWAELVLSAEDYELVADADPTNDDFEQFFNAWGEVAGESVAKSRGSSTTSRSTRRR